MVNARRSLVLSLCGLPLLACAPLELMEGNLVTIPANAERIYALTLGIGGPDLEMLEWSNRPPGQRVPGPFPLPKPDRLQLGSGFPRDLAKPILTFDRPMPTDGPLYEAYNLGFIWAVNEALKTTLDTIDPTAFDYVRGETGFPDGSRGPDYWLLEVVRFVDCYDVAGSVAVNPLFVSEHGTADFAGDGHVFRLSALGDASFFRIPQSSEWLCTERAKLRVKADGHQRVHFVEVGWAV